MAQDFAKAFYRSRRWQQCRDSYAKSVGGLCERCLSSGLITPGEIVHHKVALTPENIGDPDMALNWSNLELVCRVCHGLEHRNKRYIVDKSGHVSAR